MTSLRIFFLGGWTSYRALFGWLSPWILIPTFIIGPVLQIVFFALVGRTAGVGDDTFFLIGNAIQYASIPCLFAMGNTIGGERYSQTLSLLLASPARRVPLFLGRSLPVIVNGLLCSLIALVLRVTIPVSAIPMLVVAVTVAAFSCTGLGLAIAALGLRVRDVAVLSNIVMGVLLVFCGVNVALTAMPDWMAAIGNSLPLTHGIEAARATVAGASAADVSGLIVTEVAIGSAYLALGLLMLAYFERESRRSATLDLA